MLILSQPNTQKIRNLRHEPRVTLALDDSKHGNDVVVLEGKATLLPEPSSAVAPPAYAEKYADLLRTMNWDAATMIADYSQAIRVVPTRFIEF
jgi:PPOX class probable F420-dependent enzyme